MKNEFETIKLSKSNLIIAFFSLFFCNPQVFNILWEKINSSLINEGYFAGNFLGKRDSWAKRKELTILSKNKILKLFTGYNIIYFNEKEYDGLTGLGNKKHWHYYEIIAKKE